MPPASHQVSATSLKLLIQQIHPHVRVELVVTYKMQYVGTTFTMKMNSNDKIVCDNIVNKQHINVLK